MHRHIALAGLCLAVFLVMVGVGMAVVALPETYLRASGTTGSSGWLASFFALSYMAFQYPAGRLADRLGYRPVLAAGCLLIALSAVVFSLADSPWTLYLGRFVQGAGEAPVWACAPAYLGRLYPDNRGRAMGLYNAAFHVGLMLGPLAGARFKALSAPGSGASPFLTFACLSLAAGVLVLFAVRDTDRNPVRTARLASKTAFRPLRSLWPLVCVLPLYGAAYGLLVSCLPVHLAAEAGFSQARLGAFFFCGYAGIAAAQLVAGPLSDRHGRTRFMAWGLVLAAGGLFWTARTATVLALASVSVMGAGLGLFAVASLSLVNDLCPADSEGGVSGLYYLAWGAGYFAGPLLVNGVGLASGAGGLACACLVAAGMVPRRFRETGRDGPPRAV